MTACETSTFSHHCRVAERASLARAQRGRLLVALLTVVLLRLANLSSIDERAIAQELVGMYRWRTAIGPTVLTLEEEKVKAAKPGSEFKECASGCPVMIVIPAGKFMMGSPEHESDRQASEGPQHEVALARPFAVSKFEVRFEEWDACVAAAGCPRVADRWGRGEMPVINTSWGDAKQYVAWLSQSTGKEYRLLTEVEWEYAARAGTNTRYSWGDDPRAGNANCDGCGSPWDLKHTAPVGSLKPNAFGLHDMHGNVWEWVEDTWHQNYDGAPTDGSAWLRGGDPSYRVVRGGSWRNESEQVRAAARFRRNINVQFDTLGFRVARTIVRRSDRLILRSAVTRDPGARCDTAASACATFRMWWATVSSLGFYSLVVVTAAGLSPSILRNSATWSAHSSGDAMVRWPDD